MGEHQSHKDQLQLSLLSANFPLYDPNTNTGNEVISDTEMKVARQTVFHNSEHASYLVLPIISTDTLNKLRG